MSDAPGSRGDQAGSTAERPGFPAEKDDGLRRMLVWVLVALVLSVLAASLIARLAIDLFDTP